MRCQSRYDVKDTPRSQSIETVSFKTDETMLIKIWCQSRYGAKCQINTRYTVPIKEMASTKKTDNQEDCQSRKLCQSRHGVNQYKTVSNEGVNQEDRVIQEDGVKVGDVLHLRMVRIPSHDSGRQSSAWYFILAIISARPTSCYETAHASGISSSSGISGISMFVIDWIDGLIDGLID